MSFPVANMSMTAYQDGVDLSQVRTMLFDYAVGGSVTGAGSAFSIEILFTSTGTATLWSRSYTSASGVAAVQQLGESVSLPALSTPGRFTIRVTTTCVQGGPSAFFHIDNIRFQ